MVSSVALAPALIVFIVFGTLLAALATVCYTVVRLVGGGKRKLAVNADESQLIQELYHGLSKMAERVESLETILLEREKGGRRG